jgi:hypothetical protein
MTQRVHFLFSSRIPSITQRPPIATERHYSLRAKRRARCTSVNPAHLGGSVSGEAGLAVGYTGTMLDGAEESITVSPNTGASGAMLPDSPAAGHGRVGGVTLWR